MKKIIVLLLITVAIQANAKIWRLNKTAGNGQDFIDLSTLISSPLVLNGDTVYIEPGVTGSASTLTKKLHFFGNGDLFAGAIGANGNSGLQLNSNSSEIGLALDSLATGSTFWGIRFSYIYADTDVDSILISNCRIYSLQEYNNILGGIMDSWKIRKCYIDGGVNLYTNAKLKNFEFRNNICTQGVYMDNTANFNLVMRNNVFRSAVDLYGAYFSNNTIINSSISFSNCIVKNNISAGSNLPAGNGNQINKTDAAVFINTGSLDGKYKLAVASPAIGAGETVGGITPDIGAYGTDDPYQLSCMPPIPSIFLFTAPASVPQTATNMLINISSRSNK
jgi:hypothetical protein